MTVADEYGFTEENAPRFTAFATTQDRLYWHMDGEHRPMYIFEEEWFTPNIAKEKNTVPDIKKRVCICWNLMVSNILVLLKIQIVK